MTLRAAPIEIDEEELDASDRDLPRITRAAWNAVVASNDPPFLFQLGDRPVRLEADDRTGIVITRELTDDRLRHEAARAAHWFVTDRKGARRDALPPLAVVKDMLAARAIPLPSLNRITRAPSFTSDGELHATPGYHAGSGEYFMSAPGFSVPHVPSHPTIPDRVRAKEIIEDLFADFPFVSRSEHATAIGMFILPYVRSAISGATPLHLIEKPSPGTGATLLVDVAVAIPATGHQVSVITEGRDEDEWRKRILTKLMTSPVYIAIDNVRLRLDSAAVASAITAPVFEDRVLRTSELARIPSRCIWIATGNNPALSAELTRRTVRIRLDARIDRPWLRNGFRHPDLSAYVKEQRGLIVWAALVCARAWFAEGRPPAPSPRLGMFESWSEVIGGILHHAGVDGFLENLPAFYDAADAETTAWRGLIDLWAERFGTTAVGVADLWKLITSESGTSIDIGLGDGSERSQRSRFGRQLTRHRDRQIGEWRLVSAGVSHGSQLWRLENPTVASGGLGDHGGLFD